MTDPVDQFFEREREAVPTLSPPAGRFDELKTVARHRRNRNTTMVSAAAAVVLAVAGTGAVLGAQNLHGNSTAALKPAGPTAKVPVSASASPTVTSTAAPTVDPAVPADFTAWSVTFASPNQGWALGGYSCQGGQQCVAVLETTDDLGSWQRVADPGFAAEYGMSTGHAIIRFQSATNGWMVGSQGVYSTHDGGSTWHPIGVLQSANIDALEAWGSHVYAVGADASSLWVSSDPSSDSWVAEPGLDLPPASATTKDSISPEDGVVSVVRSTGTDTTVRLSRDIGTTWRTLSSPCASAPSQSARLFVVLDPTVGRFVCGNGQVYAVWFDGRKPKRDVTFHLRSTTGNKVVAESVAHVKTGTFVAYQGAGLQQVLASGLATNTPVPGDFSYVGMTTDTQGVALKASASNSYWMTTNGQTWHEKHFG